MINKEKLKHLKKEYFTLKSIHFRLVNFTKNQTKNYVEDCIKVKEDELVKLIKLIRAENTNWRLNKMNEDQAIYDEMERLKENKQIKIDCLKVERNKLKIVQGFLLDHKYDMALKYVTQEINENTEFIEANENDNL